jgi:hypothetical protein
MVQWLKAVYIDFDYVLKEKKLTALAAHPSCMFMLF